MKLGFFSAALALLFVSVAAQPLPFSDAQCADGILSADGQACCFKGCGACDDASSCGSRLGGKAGCCANIVKTQGPARFCSEATAPCRMAAKPAGDPTCANGKKSADGKYCCMGRCEKCDGSSTCSTIAGSKLDYNAEHCCTFAIQSGHKMCNEYQAPCIMGNTNPEPVIPSPIQGTCPYCMTNPLALNARIISSTKPYLVEKMWPYRPEADQCCYRCQQRSDCGAWLWEDGFCHYYPRRASYSISTNATDRVFRRVAAIRTEIPFCENSDPTCRTGVFTANKTACCKKGCSSCKTSNCTQTDINNGCCATAPAANRKCIYNMPPCQMEPQRGVDSIGGACWLRISALGQVPADGGKVIFQGAANGTSTTARQTSCVSACASVNTCTTAWYKGNVCTLYSGSKGGKDVGATPNANAFNMATFEQDNGAAWVRSQCKGCCAWTGENFSGSQNCWTTNVTYFGAVNNLQNSLHTAGNCKGSIWTKQKYGGEGGNYLTYWPGLAYKNMSPPWKEETSSLACSCS